LLPVFSTLGDVNGAFLLLTWGANPDTRDASGDTPLLWLIKNKPIAVGTSGQELIKMLFRFGANPMLDNGVDGNTLLHVLGTVKGVDAKACFVIYQASGPAIKTAKNNNGLNPYAVRSWFVLSGL
jgi:ankyrin repeat protein